jgi:hypothetical protein
MNYAGVDPGKELLSTGNALFNRRISIGLRRVAVYLSGIENGVPPREEQP